MQRSCKRTIAKTRPKKSVFLVFFAYQLVKKFFHTIFFLPSQFFCAIINLMLDSVLERWKRSTEVEKLSVLTAETALKNVAEHTLWESGQTTGVGWSVPYYNRAEARRR